MFDEYYSEHHSKTEVKVEQAGVHDAAKYYRDMRERAEKDIVASISLSNNIVNATGVVFGNEATCSSIIRYRFSINGHVVEGEEELEDMVVINASPKFYKNAFAQIISAQVAKYLTSYLFENTRWER